MARRKKVTTKKVTAVVKNKVGRPVTREKGVSSNGLVGMLWDTMKGLEAKTTDPANANSIASQSREICRVAKVNIEYAKLTGQKPANLFS